MADVEAAIAAAMSAAAPSAPPISEYRQLSISFIAVSFLFKVSRIDGCAIISLFSSKVSRV